MTSTTPISSITMPNSEPVTTVADRIFETLSVYYEHPDSLYELVHDPDYVKYDIEHHNAPSFIVRCMNESNFLCEISRITGNLLNAHSLHNNVFIAQSIHDLLMCYLFRYGNPIKSIRGLKNCSILAPRYLEFEGDLLNVDCLIPISGPGYSSFPYKRCESMVKQLIAQFDFEFDDYEEFRTPILYEALSRALPYLNWFPESQSNFSPKRTSTSPSNIRGRKPRSERISIADKNCNNLDRERKRSRSKFRDDKYSIEPQSYFNPIVNFDPKVVKVAEDLAKSTSKLTDFITGPASAEARRALGAFVNSSNSEPTDETKNYFIRLRKLFFAELVDESTISQATKTTIALGIAATGIYHLYNRTDNSWYAFIACTTFGVGYLATAPIMEIIGRMNKFPKGTESQADTGDVDTLVGSLITLLLGSTVHNDGYSTKSFLKGLSEFSRVKNSLSDITKMCIEILQRCVNGFRHYILSKGPYRFLNTGSHDIDEFLSMYDVITEEWDSKTFYFTAANISRLKQAEDIGNKITRELLGKDHFKSLARPVTMALNYIKECKKKAIAANPGFEGMRVEPVGVLLIGGPGVGKSLALEHISNAIAATCLSADERDVYVIKPYQFSHNRQFENDHWDGLTAQNKIIYYDDIAQNRTAAGTPNNEFMEVVRGINSFPYLCHMAALEGKGNTFFHAEFVLCTTNDQNLSNESVKDQDAVKRRFHLPYVVYPKDEYALDMSVDVMHRKFDISKLPIGCEGIASMHPSACLYGKYDFRTKMCYRAIEFHEVLEEIFSMHRLQKVRFTQYKKEVDETYARYCPPDKSDSGIVSQSNFDLQLEDLSIEEEENFGYSDYPVVDEFIFHLVEALADVKHPDHDEFSAKLYYQDHYIRKIGSDQLGVPGVLAMHGSLGNSYLLRFNECSPSEFEEYLFKSSRTPTLRPTPICSKVVTRSIWTEIKQQFSDLNDMFQQWLYTTVLPSLDATLQFIWDNFPMVALCSSLFGVTLGLSYNQGIINRNVQSNSFWINKCHKKVDNVDDHVYEVLDKIEKMDEDQQLLLKTLLQPEAQSITSSHKSASNPKLVLRDYKGVRDSIRSQGGDINGEALANSIVKSNSWEFHVQQTDGGEFQHMGYVLMVRGRIALLPYHFVKKLIFHYEEGNVKLDYIVKLIKNEKVFLFTFQDIISNFETGVLEENDLCLVELPKKMQPCRDITNNFISIKDLNNVQTYDFILMGDVKSRFEGKAVPQHIPWKVSSTDIEDYYIQHSYRYHASTVVGDCGKTLFIHNRTNPTGKIVGLHTSGIPGSSVGWAGGVIREDLLTSLDKFGPQIDDQSISDDIEDFIIAQGQFSPIRIERSTPSINVNSAIIRSRIVPTWRDTVQAPARLKNFYLDGVKVEPMMNAYKKYCFPDVVWDSYIVDSICDSIYDNLLNCSTKHVQPRIYTFEEATRGIPGIFNSIPRATSIGWPYNAMSGRKSKGKTGLFGTGSEFTYEGPMFLQWKKDFDETERDAMNGIRRLHVYTDFPKDCLVAIQKAIIGKTRLISGAPTKYGVLFRKYFGAFMTWCVENRIDNNFANGVNPYSNEWDAIAKKLNKFGPHLDNKGDIDYAGFDGTQKPALQWSIMWRIVQRWYGDEFGIVREVLWLELVNSRHIWDYMLYEWDSSLPSGNPFTIFINCLINEFYFRYAWVDIRGGLRYLCEYERSVATIFQGDDADFAVHQAYIEVFTENTIAQALFKQGVNLTSGDKTGTRTSLRNISEISFLKRKYRFCEIEQKFVAPIDLEVIYELPLWTKKGDDSDTIVKGNVKSALQELSLHGKLVFNDLAPKIIKAYFDAYGEYPEKSTFFSNHTAVHKAEYLF
jgi:hypothetical protein